MYSIVGYNGETDKRYCPFHLSNPTAACWYIWGICEHFKQGTFRAKVNVLSFVLAHVGVGMPRQI